MRTVEIQGAWGIENLKLVDRPQPAPGPGEVGLKMRAASANFRDLAVTAGKYNASFPLPLVPFSDGVGIVDAVGPGVTRFKVGDRAATLFFPHWLAGPPLPEFIAAQRGGSVPGVLQDYLVGHADGFSPVPSTMTDEEAATLPCAALTAWRAVVTEGNIKAGQVVLVQGTGGVALFALQIAKLLGATVIVTSKSDDKLERVRELGADHTINYATTPDWGVAARDWTGGRGVDLVVETAWGASVTQSIKATRNSGIIVLIGLVAGPVAEIDIRPLLFGNIRLQGVGVGSRLEFDDMVRAFEAHKLQPEIDRIFPLEETIAALTYLKGANHIGKVCLTFC